MTCHYLHEDVNSTHAHPLKRSQAQTTHIRSHAIVELGMMILTIGTL